MGIVRPATETAEQVPSPAATAAEESAPTTESESLDVADGALNVADGPVRHLDSVAAVDEQRLSVVDDGALPNPSRRARLGLEKQVLEVTLRFESGQLSFAGKPATAHRIAQAICEIYDLKKAPSAGAVSNVLSKWAQYRYCELGSHPTAYLRRTNVGMQDGLDVLRKRFQETHRTTPPAP